MMMNDFENLKGLINALLEDLVDSGTYNTETITLKLCKFIAEQNIDEYKTYLNCYGCDDKATLDKLERISKLDIRLNTAKISMGVMYEIYTVYTDYLMNNSISNLEKMFAN